eukprot:m.520648 g.520648  ORF g.520648 m.520648 type:complete len:395 (-) comp21953_c0_seq7:400-1584(-)
MSDKRHCEKTPATSPRDNCRQTCFDTSDDVVPSSGTISQTHRYRNEPSVSMASSYPPSLLSRDPHGMYAERRFCKTSTITPSHIAEHSNLHRERYGILRGTDSLCEGRRRGDMHPNAAALSARPRSKTLSSMWAPGRTPASPMGSPHMSRRRYNTKSTPATSHTDPSEHAHSRINVDTVLDEDSSAGRGISNGFDTEHPWGCSDGGGHSSPALSDGSSSHTLGGITEGPEPASDSDSDELTGDGQQCKTPEDRLLERRTKLQMQCALLHQRRSAEEVKRDARRATERWIAQRGHTGAGGTRDGVGVARTGRRPRSYSLPTMPTMPEADESGTDGDGATIPLALTTAHRTTSANVRGPTTDDLFADTYGMLHHERGAAGDTERPSRLGSARGYSV